jgi:hypothetical protein
VPDANAAARAANDRLRGVSKEDSLLGGPSMSRDPYRSALDAEDTRQSDLMGAERVPNGVMNRNGYDPVPPAKGAPNARAPAADAGADAALNPVGMEGNAAGGGGKARANTPAQAAQKLYRAPFKGNDGAQQVYRSPW